MNDKNLKLAQNFVTKAYIDLAQDSINSRENLINTLLSQRSLPQYGWDELTIEYFLNVLATMDTNNFPGKIGVGERESRIFSSFVQKRHFYMGHGIGRSGDIAAIQPKAAGSSLVLKLAKCLAKDALKVMGLQSIQDILLLPFATGMSLSMVLLAMQSKKPNAKYVIWSRIDQKTCLKCIKTVNLQPVVVELIQDKDELITDVKGIEEQINKLKPENVLCVLSTTSCFAPRVPDKIEDIAKICEKYDVNHVINNAYGLQCPQIVGSLNKAQQNGRVDAVVQSTDKNFMVPVGGSIVLVFEQKQNKQKKLTQEQQKEISKLNREEKAKYYQNLNKQNNPQQKTITDQISELYPGRASAAPIMDLFITLLQMGKYTLLKLLEERQENLQYAKKQIQEKFTSKYGEKLLNTPNNSISLAITLKSFENYITNNNDDQDDDEDENNEEQKKTDDQVIQELVKNKLQEKNDMTQLGSILYGKRVMGSRILTQKKAKKVCGFDFLNYGSHSDSYTDLPYITVAVAIGMEKKEIDIFIERLEESLDQLKKKVDKKKEIIKQNIQDQK